MKTKLAIFTLACAVAAFGQHGGRPGGGPAGPPAGVGMGSSSSPGAGHAPGGDIGHPPDSHPGPGDHGPGTHGGPGSHHDAQQPLNDHQINGGAFRMLERRTGMTADQLKTLYASSGAHNFGQFASAVVVSKNLDLDTNRVLDGLKTQSLGRTLQALGVAPDKAKDAARRAEREVKESEKRPS